MNGVLALHEISHETKKNGEVGVVLKLDFEKAYDKVNREFLFDSLLLWGFSDTWCSWIKKVVTNGIISVKLNDKLGPYFVSHKGVRQGDPSSPILFNFVVDCMARMVRKAQTSGLITGLASNLIPNGVVLLQYADDTIVCMKNDIEGARNMKLLLYLYELMSGLKINFSKSEIITIHGDDSLNLQYAELFNCQIGNFPIKYLGVPVSPSRLHICDWMPLVEKNKKKLAAWKGGSMSIAGRTTLINANLSSAFTYHIYVHVAKNHHRRTRQAEKIFFLARGLCQKEISFGSMASHL